MGHPKKERHREAFLFQATISNSASEGTPATNTTNALMNIMNNSSQQKDDIIPHQK
jgi:hypothetical protein